MTHFVIVFGMREKWPALKYVSPVLTQNQRIWNMHGSLTSNNGKIFDILEAIGIPLCQV